MNNSYKILAKTNFRRIGFSIYLLVHIWGKQEWLHFIYHEFINGLDRIIMSQQNITILKCFEA